jgi:hypothetical protein
MLLLGTGDKTARVLEAASRGPFLLIADDGTAAACAERFPDAPLFNLRNHSFAIRRDYDGVRDFADIVFPDKDLMTYMHGKRELVKLLLDTTTPITELAGDTKNPAIAEALAAIEDLLLSPVLRRVLTRKPNFDFERSVIAALDGIYHEDARKLASMLIGQHKGHVIVPDFGFYGRPLHLSLIRQKRLTAGLSTLSEAPLSLQQPLLTIPEKYGAGCTYDDAVVLAKYAGLVPDFSREDNPYNRFIREAVGG